MCVSTTNWLVSATHWLRSIFVSLFELGFGFFHNNVFLSEPRSWSGTKHTWCFALPRFVRMFVLEKPEMRRVAEQYTVYYLCRAFLYYVAPCEFLNLLPERMINCILCTCVVSLQHEWANVFPLLLFSFNSQQVSCAHFDLSFIDTCFHGLSQNLHGDLLSCQMMNDEINKTNFSRDW